MKNSNLLKWLAENNLQAIYNFNNENVFQIKGFGKFYLLESQNCKNDDFKLEKSKRILFPFETLPLVISPKTKKKILENECEFVAYEFGGRFYYRNFVDYDEELRIQFNDLKYLGEFDGDSIPQIAIHTQYELLNGCGLIDEYLKKAKFMGVSVLGICDFNTLSGTLYFQKSCEKYGIKSILGATFSVRDEYGQFEYKFYVKNKKGWQNLLKLNKIINIDKNDLSNQNLLTYSEGLKIVFNEKSFLTSKMPKNKKKALLEDLKKCYGKIYYQIDTKQYFSEVFDKEYLENVKSFLYSDYFDYFDLILMNDVYYTDREFFECKEILNKVSGDYVYPVSNNQHFKSLEENKQIILKLFKNQGAEEVFDLLVENLIDFCNDCDFSIQTGKHKLPKFKMENVSDNVRFFRELVESGFKQKIVDKGLNQDEYRNRLELEFKVITNANFTDYFLILWDIVNFAKQKEIMVGVGRGSVGGCLLAYLLHITELDPIKYNLLFERFLNETRISGERAKSADALPDVDLDFMAFRKEEVKKYIEERYGFNQVCSIGTYTRMKLRTCLKDLMKLKGIPFEKRNEYTKHIHDELEYKWEDLFIFAFKSKNKEFMNFIKMYPKTFNLIKYILNQAKASSIHPSAVIITPEYDEEGNRMEVWDWMPIKKVGEQLVSQWEGKYTDFGGFLKEDILGLSQLDKFDNINKLILKNKGYKIDFNEIKFDDKKTFDLFKMGLNEDVFQFNSSTFKSYSRELKPDRLEEIIAANALIRPGTMRSNAHMDYVYLKFGKKEPEYDLGMEEVTSETFGLYVYQEQIMKALIVAGLTAVESDEARTAIKKFNRSILDNLKEKFIKGYVQLLKDRLEP